VSSGGVRVTGLNKLTRELQGLGLEVDDLKEAFSDIAADAADKAAQFAPRRSGKLAGTIRGNRAKNKAVVTAGRGKVRYAGPINYGWPKRNIRADGFMQRADDAVRPTVVERLTQNIQRVIDSRGL
jgi:hypothetical protein